MKSGYRGGAEATEQVFEWVERRLTEGSQVILPAGTRITGPGGRVSRMAKDMVFTYGGPGGGFSPLGKLRSVGGLDRLRVLGANEQTGQGTSVAAGSCASSRARWRRWR